MASLERVEVGNTHTAVEGSQDHDWTVFVRDPNQGGKRTLENIAQVTFTLHQDFKPNHIVTVKSPPFQVARKGWGEFEVLIDVILSDGSAHSMTHLLSFQQPVTSALVDLEGDTPLTEAQEDETPRMVAIRLGIDPALLVHKNKKRFPGLRAHSKLQGGTTLLLPSAQDTLPASSKKRPKKEPEDTPSQADLTTPASLGRSGTGGSRRSARLPRVARVEPPPPPPPPEPVKPPLGFGDVLWLEGADPRTLSERSCTQNDEQIARELHHRMLKEPDAIVPTALVMDPAPPVNMGAASSEIPEECLGDLVMVWATIQRFNALLMPRHTFPLSHLEKVVLTAGTTKLGSKIHTRLVQALMDLSPEYHSRHVPLNNLTWPGHLQGVLELSLTSQSEGLPMQYELILEAVLHQDDDDLFNEPIEHVIPLLEGYEEAVPEPMDLTKIARRLKNEKYSADVGEAELKGGFAYELRLVWNNCLLYHGPDTTFSTAARRLERVFEEEWAKLISGADSQDSGQHSQRREEQPLWWLRETDYDQWSIHQQVEVLSWLVHQIVHLSTPATGAARELEKNTVRELVDLAMESTLARDASPTTGAARVMPFQVAADGSRRWWSFEEESRVFVEDTSSGGWRVCGLLAKPAERTVSKDESAAESDSSAWLSPTQLSDEAQLKAQFASIERGLRDSIGARWFDLGVRDAWRVALEESECSVVRLRELLLGLEAEACSQLRAAVEHLNLFCALPRGWQLHRAVWQRNLKQVSTLSQLSWLAVELHEALAHLMASEQKPWLKLFKNSAPAPDPGVVAGCQLPPNDNSTVLFLGREHIAAVQAAVANGSAFEEEKEGGTMAPISEESFECTVLSSSCHVSLREQPCYLVELEVVRKLQLPDGVGSCSPTLAQLRAHGFLQETAEVTKCKKCEQPAVAGNYGFCLDHREFKGSGAAAPLAASGSALTMVTKKENKPVRQSSLLCRICHTGTGTELLACDSCPRGFHARCAASTPMYAQKSCAAHRCDKCHLPGSSAASTVRGKPRKNAIQIATVELAHECLHCNRSFCKRCGDHTVGAVLPEGEWWLCHSCAQSTNKLSTLIECVLSRIFGEPCCEPFVKLGEENGLAAVALKAKMGNYSSLGALEQDMWTATATPAQCGDGGERPMLRMMAEELQHTVRQAFKVVHAVAARTGVVSEARVDSAVPTQAAAAAVPAQARVDNVVPAEAAAAVPAQAAAAVPAQARVDNVVPAEAAAAVPAQAAVTVPAQAAAVPAQTAPATHRGVQEAALTAVAPEPAPLAAPAEATATGPSVAKASVGAVGLQAAPGEVNGSAGMMPSKHVKRPKTSYMWWLDAHRDEMRLKHTGVPYHEFNRLMGLHWSQLPDTERAPWTLLGTQDRDRYKQELQECEQAGITPYCISHEGAKKSGHAPNSAHVKYITTASIQQITSVASEHAVQCSTSEEGQLLKGVHIPSKGLIRCSCGCGELWEPSAWALEHADNPEGSSAILFEASKRPLHDVWDPVPFTLSKTTSSALELSRRARDSQVQFVDAGDMTRRRFTVVVHSPNQAFLSLKLKQEPKLFEDAALDPTTLRFTMTMRQRDQMASSLRVGDVCVLESEPSTPGGDCWKLAHVVKPVAPLTAPSPEHLLQEEDRVLHVTFCNRLMEKPGDPPGYLRFRHLGKVERIPSFAVIDSEPLQVRKSVQNELAVPASEIRGMIERYNARLASMYHP